MARGGHLAPFALKKSKNAVKDRLLQKSKRAKARARVRGEAARKRYKAVEEQDDSTNWGHPLGIRPSELLPHLDGSEKVFFKLILKGDVRAVEKFILSHPSLNINCEDYQGHTALILAIKINHVEMVNFLLSLEYLIIGDAILHAVQTGNCTIVELLLDSMKRSGSEMSFPGCIESAEFSPDITPLILAAQCHHYRVVKLLLERGHTIYYPHPPGCFCKEDCNWKHKGESLNDSKSRLHAYQALSSPTYICQCSSDPVLTSFRLSRELWICSRFEKELKNEYRDLSTNVSQFAVDLLQQCRTSEEVEMVLKQRTPSQSIISPYPRVSLAIHCKQRKFVAHSHTQHVLLQAWLGEYQYWRGLDTKRIILRILPQFILLPIMALIYLLAPKSKLAQRWSSPVNKLTSFTISYMTFIVILYTHNELDNTSYVRGPPDTGFEWLVIVYVLGFVWSSIRRCWKQGTKAYFKQKWHVYDVIMLFLFCATFAIWGWAWQDVRVYGHRFIPRRFWYQYDPTLLAEALYAVATIVAFGKLLYFFQLGSRLGPLQVSIGRMFKDIFDFLVVFLVVLVSFATGMHKLYHYYKGQVRRINGEQVVQKDAFVTFHSTISSMFWALFGYSPPEFADIVVSEQKFHFHNQTLIHINEHKFTEFVGYMLYGAYNITAIIILLNLLIAMMSTSFIIVQENADIEWKFARTSVWLMFLEKGSTMPPPFNLIPNPKSIWASLKWLKEICRGNSSARFSAERCCYYEEDDIPEYTMEEYEILMGHLVKRYLRITEKQHYQDRANDISELQNLYHGISSFPDELLIRKPTRDTSDSQVNQSALSSTSADHSESESVPDASAPLRPRLYATSDQTPRKLTFEEE